MHQVYDFTKALCPGTLQRREHKFKIVKQLMQGTQFTYLKTTHLLTALGHGETLGMLAQRHLGRIRSSSDSLSTALWRPPLNQDNSASLPHLWEFL